MQTVNLALAALVMPPALAFGSFVNVVAARVPLRRSISHPRSACLACSAPITARDNIPVLSYVLLHGRCRHCGARISPLYPAVELLTAALVAVCVLVFGATPYTALAAFFCVTLVTLTAADLRYRLVPNRIVMPAFVICLLARTAIDPSVEWVAAALAAATLMLVFALVHPAGLGMGDVKLTLLLGAMLGRTVGPALLIGFVAALVPSVVLFARHGSKARKMAIPLVPFLAFGALVALFFGDRIVDWYTGLGT
jgi:leader peptidase (prepilin peptidase) / N-methyltransferase